MSQSQLLDSRVERKLRAVGLAGLIVLLLGLLIAPAQVWPGCLLAVQYVLGLGLGSLFFVALMVVCGANWHERFRRVPEALAGTLRWTAPSMLLVAVFGLSWLYGWSAHHDGHHAAPFRDAWLQPGFFRVRALLYVGLWLLLLAPVLGAARRTPPDAGVAAGFIVLFAISFVLASFDWLMSLDTHWFSTILGVYNFAGTFLSALAAICFLAIALRHRGLLHVPDDALHDLGKLIHAFSVFWAYIWFSQYMLIWYANFPEETSYYLLRHAPGWASLSLLNVALNWGLPFIVLLPRSAKRSESTLQQMCALLLIGRAVDLYWMIVPPLASHGLGVHLWALVALGTASIGMAAVTLRSWGGPSGASAPAEAISPWAAP